MKQLFYKIALFAVRTFPDSDYASHLLKLKHEADEAIEDPVLEEFADCQIALMGGVYKAGFTYTQFMNAIKNKLEINEKRKWIRQPDGTYQHSE